MTIHPGTLALSSDIIIHKHVRYLKTLNKFKLSYSLSSQPIQEYDHETPFIVISSVDNFVFIITPNDIGWDETACIM